MDEIHVYVTDLHGAKEMILPCSDGYTVYMDASLTREQMEYEYDHICKHIESGHWDLGKDLSVSEMEHEAHR